ncbi:hypothetical protein HYT84_03750 [Candidatus Micrarchaeota archaeon]|nr:hypothetical protein [Candidatus Micrarchaeota archaeon]
MDLPLLFTFWQFPEPAVWYIGVSLLLGLAATALFYLGAYFFQHPPMNAAAKEELAAFLMSLAIIGLWFFIQASLGKFTCLLATNNPGCNSSFIDLSSGSLEILFLKLRSIYMSLYLFEVLLGFLSTVYVPLGTFNPLLSLLPVSLPPLVSLSLLSNAHTVLVEAIGMTMVAIIAKQHLLQFAQYGVPTVLLPLGLALRAFPWFRATGSSLIAICIVAYFVYPLSTLLSNYLIFDLFQPLLDSATQMILQTPPKSAMKN